MAPPDHKKYIKLYGQMFMNRETGDICMIYSEYLRKKIGNIKDSEEYKQIINSHRKHGGAELREKIARNLVYYNTNIPV